ncbi:MAG: FAD-binding protein [Microbacterium sp.]
MTEVGASWAGTHVYGAQALFEPTTVGELQDIVAASPRVRALGTRHSFNDIADTSGVLVGVGRLVSPVEVSADRRSAWVPAGLPYGLIARELHAQGLALANLGSLPHISVGGACAVGTHGSGNRNRNLSGSVVGMELVTASGDLLTVDSTTPDFAGMVVHLGALGIVTRVELAVVPTFDVRQDVFVELPWQTLLDDVDRIMAGAYSVSVFLHWSVDTVREIWVKSTADATLDESLFGAARALPTHAGPIVEVADNTTPTDGSFGPWHERLPHFRFDATPSHGDEIQSEYFVPRSRAAEALAALRPLGARIDPLLLTTELRSVAADDLWLSPAFQRDSLAIHFTWKNRPDEVAALLPAIEEALLPLDARPHWGKWFRMPSAAILAQYDRAGDFRALAERFDPGGRFRNDFLARTIAL